MWPVLCCVEGDIPWLEKLTNSIGHTAKRACFRCAQNGVWDVSTNTVRSVLVAYEYKLYPACPASRS